MSDISKLAEPVYFAESETFRKVSIFTTSEKPVRLKKNIKHESFVLEMIIKLKK